MQFRNRKATRESHPFTLCGSPDDPILSIIVKARGEFTRSVYQNIKSGNLLRVKGPYGRFDYTKAGQQQIWIAGGIGIVPFLAWARLFGRNPDQINKIDLFYCVHWEEDAVFAEEFYNISLRFPFFKFYLFCSEKNSHLSIEKIQQLAGCLADKKILMCGPKRLTKDFNKKFQFLGVKRENIIFEDFEFF